MGCLLNQSPKFNSNVFLLVALTTFNFGEVLIGWIIIKLSVQIFQPLSLHCRNICVSSFLTYINLSPIVLSLYILDNDELNFQFYSICQIFCKILFDDFVKHMLYKNVNLLKFKKKIILKSNMNLTFRRIILLVI